MKRVLRPERLRQVPRQFSWIDQRLVRDGYLSRCSAEGLALYLFLVTVGDAQGLSYYGEKAIERSLALNIESIVLARAELVHAGLIAYERPLYQVLSLERSVVADKGVRGRAGQLCSVASVLRLALEGK